MMALRRSREAEYEANERAEAAKHIADGDDVPDIQFDYPPCPVCTGLLECDGSWSCGGCGVVWDENGTGGTITDPGGPLAMAVAGLKEEGKTYG